MSSIRSLATITVLAGVGIVLYMKINETEPVVPAEVANFEIGEISFDSQEGEPSALPQFSSAPANSSAPAYEAAPQFGVISPGDSAPAFDPGSTAAPSEQASAWNDSPVANAPPALSTPAVDPPADAGNAQVAVIASVPELPTIPSAASATQPAMPAVEQPSTSQINETVQNFNAPAFPAAVGNAPSQPVASSVDNSSQAQSSLFSATRLAVEAALDRGQLSQALLLLSDWYDDPSLSPTESQEVDTLLGQLAGTVIYSTEHRLEPPYMVQAGERLEEIAQKYQIPWQLLAKINGITQADQLQPGQQLKVIRGPFSALIDMGRRKMTLMLDRRYAGQFSLDIDLSNTVEAGQWTVNQKLLTPGSVGFGSSGAATEEQSLMLSNPDGSTGQLAILRGSNATTPTGTQPAGRVIRLNSQEIGDVYDILSLGSRVVIRR